MSSRSICDELDEAVEAILTQPDAVPGEFDPVLRDLLEVAADLRTLPSAEFRLRLGAELQQKAAVANGGKVVAFPVARDRRLASAPRTAALETDILPTLFGSGYGNYPVHRANFLVSALLHMAAIAALITSSMWMMQHRQELRQQVISLLSEPSDYVLPPAQQKAGGGGGGGDSDKLAASRGSAPRFAREQITPPAVVIRNETPKLAAEATVVGPPDLTMPQMGVTGDPLAGVLGPPSNGTGSGGGIGRGDGGGIGSGTGPGVGAGHGGGIGGGVYRVGGGVSAPRVIYDPDPEYSEEARKAKYQGSVVLWVVVGADGRPREIRVTRPLGMGLDEKATEAVRKWRFAPSMRDGHPVAVQINVEVNFRLY